MTIQALRCELEAALARGGVPEHVRQARLIVAHVCGLPPLELALHARREVDADRLSQARALAARRLRGEPWQYIVGSQAFLDMTLRVAPGVLIPRPETEELCLRAVARLAQVKEDCPLALDLCTGSGALALGLARGVARAQVDAADISDAALCVARENARLLGLAGRVHFYQGDLWQALPARRYGVIVSNPPYIPQAQLDALQREVRDFEPRMALDGGADGLDFYRRIAQGAPAFLAPWGTLLLEVGAGQADAVAALLAPHFAHVRAYRDMQGVARMLEATNQAEDEHVAG
nr:peptide chain release factor N(5)-glutamine methyltransferase [Maliibacterium massiliense]